MTAGQLAARLEVSERTIQRDMEALSMAGIPVVAERGIGGGWSLIEGYQTRLTGLHEDEIRALFLSSPPNLLTDLGLQRASEGAIIKLLAALPAMYRRDAEFIRQRIHIDSSRWHRSTEDLSCLPALQDALWQEREVKLVYVRSDGETVQRTADPLGLVAKGSIWYLVAAIEGEIRTYRVSRIQNVSISDEHAVRPPDFDLAAYWNESLAEFVESLPRYPAILRADPASIPMMRALWRFAQFESIGEPARDGRVEMCVVFEVLEEACASVLGFGPQVEVLEPRELRDKVIAMARGVVDDYASRAGS
jgi:predicted DNA-binding transcriptional regulator YafY